MDNNIKVSVSCLVYNHAPYLRKCLDGFISQKTNFDFEVIVHDDASTDNSAEIIKEYALKYPKIFVPILQTENQHSKKVKITQTIVVPLMRGKYMAQCEGDDYWSDENKLQRQYDFMETHPECLLCTHVVEAFDSNTGEITQTIPTNDVVNNFIKFGKRDKSCSDVICIDGKDYFRFTTKSNYNFQTSSFFFKTEVIRKYINEKPKFMLVSDVGDMPLFLYLMSNNSFGFIPKTMSRYRTNNGGSWTNRNLAKDNEKMMKHFTVQYNLWKEYNIYTDYKYNKYVLNMEQMFMRRYYYMCKTYNLPYDKAIFDNKKLKLFRFKLGAIKKKLLSIIKK